MLYVVGTPIGNLEDMTFRAVRILKSVDIIFAEDTRQTKKLLNHYEIETTIYSYHMHNREHQIINILNLLNEGKTIALVTDAGMPCISDPGFELVEAVQNAKIKVESVPGPTALTTAAAISGINLRRFVFEGFLPKKKGRQTYFTYLKDEKRPIVFYESPYRVLKSLKDIEKYFGNVHVVIARELTKMYEEVIKGPVSELITKLEAKPIKGEVVIIVEKERLEAYVDDES
ncbi:MAG: 16S rRNA (cytidine(1402)-2'-O)-methyltransferase [Fusobacteria bacterium]|nr:16S rRNA (cytidine(1402)-2'-O)-methyltransferase [Fusobacteriota bacterium]